MISSGKLLIILSFVGLYFLSAGSSWAIFSYLRETPDLDYSGDVSQTRSKIGEGLPKTEECPINGKLYSEPERAIWESRRPIAAMVENHADSRPPSGLSRADVVYEMVAEGGITRFLSVFYCGAAADDVKIAPVRSARVHFISYAAEYGTNPIFLHVGGANDFSGYGDTAKSARALELLATMGWRQPKSNDFDTTYDSGFPVFWRNYERLDRQVATEHTMMASLDAAYKEAEKRGFSNVDPEGNAWDEDFVSWKFKDGNPVLEPEASLISFSFWDNGGDYDVSWRYDKETNSYLRENGGEKHVDLETGTQLNASNVIVLFAKERGPVDRNLHILYTTIGKGTAVVFQNGQAIDATWKKATDYDRTIIYDESGDEIGFVKGQTWIEILPLGNDIDY